MHTFPVPRRQGDNRQDEYSRATAIEFDQRDEESRDRTRQEFKQETDINVILSRFNPAIGLPQRAVTYGEQDFTIDLQQAHIAISDAQKTWMHLPKHLRIKYPNWQKMLDAMHRGDLKKDLEDHQLELARRKDAEASKKEDTKGGPET